MTTSQQPGMWPWTTTGRPVGHTALDDTEPVGVDPSSWSTPTSDEESDQ